MDSFKVRIVRLGLKQIELAEILSDHQYKFHVTDVNRVVNGKSRKTPGDTKLMIKLDRYLTELEKERGIR